MGSDAEESEIEEIIEMASKASVVDQQKQVQENIHSQIKNFCSSMDKILLPTKEGNELDEPSAQPTAAPRRSGLSFAVGKVGPPANRPGK